MRVLPLVRHVKLPYPASARTRTAIPPGYGVQEQCLPFTSATALGYVIPAPISFGLCQPDEVPAHARAFRSPLDRPGPEGFKDPRVYYVKDDPTCRFVGNAYTFDAIGLAESTGHPPDTLIEPGISFFDREDQDELFKLHLPYILRTPPGIASLFLPAINREVPALPVLAGLVETDWYANPVNLVIRKPHGGKSLHIDAGELVAQVVFVPHCCRQPELAILPHHARVARDLRLALADWYRRHAKDRSAYKKLARKQHGHVPRRP